MYRWHSLTGKQRRLFRKHITKIPRCTYHANPLGGLPSFAHCTCRRTIQHDVLIFMRLWNLDYSLYNDVLILQPKVGDRQRRCGICERPGSKITIQMDSFKVLTVTASPNCEKNRDSRTTYAHIHNRKNANVKNNKL